MIRVIAFILLLFSLVALTGFGAVASAMTNPETAEACCQHGEEEDRDRGQAEPCSTLECSCPHCLFLERPGSLFFSFLRNPSKFSYGPLRTISPSEFISLIEYPPETV